MPDAIADRDHAVDIVSRARTVAPTLLARAQEIDALGRLPADVASMLVEEGFFRITVPRSMGGLGLGPSDLWRAVFEIGRGCASSAWLVGLTGANLLMLSKFPVAAQEEAFLSDRPAIVPLLTGGVGHNVVVRRTADGLTVSGTWRYASGIDIASMVGMLVSVPGDDGTSADMVVLVDQAAFEIDHDSWRVLGMRGTGSKSVSLREAFVPHHRQMPWVELQAGRVAADCPHREPQFHLPLTSVFAMSVLAPTLGVASGIVDEFRSIVASRVLSGTRERQVDDKVSHIRLSEADSWMQILRTQLVVDCDDLLARTAAGHALSVAERAALRSRIALGARHALHVCQTVFQAIGGAVLPAPSRIERGLRDIHGMASHFLLQPDPIGEINGRVMLGLDLPPSARL